MTKPKKEKNTVNAVDGPVLAEIELSRIESNPWQPRGPTDPSDEEVQNLLNSIKAVGQKMPILVRSHPEKEGRFQLGDGAMRKFVQGKLGKKTIKAVIEPLTDRQMKILAIAANTFVRLRDADKEAGVYKLWESEFKTKSEDRKGRFTGEYSGLSDMETEIGISKQMISRYLQGYEARHKMMREAPKEVKEAVKTVSNFDMAAIATVAKESPKAAQQIAVARASDDAALRSKDVQEIVKTFKETPPMERAKIVEKMITEKRDLAKAIDAAKDASNVRVEKMRTDVLPAEERTKLAAKLSDEQDKKTREAETKLIKDAMISKEREDSKTLQEFIDLELRTQASASEMLWLRIVNIRNQNVKNEAIVKVRSIAKMWAEFAARFKEA
jgi:ParB/RepB/Spo0J family partition protein